MMEGINVIAGPCSAESESQVMLAASMLKNAGVKCFRAGLWKPRTHPGCFEGVGEKGIPWLQRVQRELGLKVCTEVAGSGHVKACLDAGIDSLWIGARTTVNTFLVQEIAEALKGRDDVSVLVKNPVSRDLGLWIGAVERLRGQGITGISLIHRGFSTFKKTRYRNSPEWQVAIEMHSRFPELPMLCDPSHIAGDSALVAEVARQALDLGFNSLMVEVHPSPGEALSDAAQQLTPDEFSAMMSTLRTRRSGSDNPEFTSRLEELRSGIDSLDLSLLEILSERMELSRQIGEIKRLSSVSILQMDRWKKLLSDVTAAGARMGLSEEFVGDLFSLIHEASISEQNS